MAKKRRKFTQSMTAHSNVSDKFSELHYKILAYGKETGITRHTRTNGSPRVITEDYLAKGENRFDILKASGVGMFDWVEANIGNEE